MTPRLRRWSSQVQPGRWTRDSVLRVARGPQGKVLSWELGTTPQVGASGSAENRTHTQGPEDIRQPCKAIASHALCRLATIGSMLTRWRPDRWERHEGHLQNTSVGATLKGPPSPSTPISLSPSVGSPGAQDHHPELLPLHFLCPRALLVSGEHPHSVHRAWYPLLSAQPLPLLSLTFFRLFSHLSSILEIFNGVQVQGLVKAPLSMPEF